MASLSRDSETYCKLLSASKYIYIEEAEERREQAWKASRGEEGVSDVRKHRQGFRLLYLGVLKNVNYEFSGPGTGQE